MVQSTLTVVEVLSQINTSLIKTGSEFIIAYNKADGKIYRVDKNGVATVLINPINESNAYSKIYLRKPNTILDLTQQKDMEIINIFNCEFNEVLVPANNNIKAFHYDGGIVEKEPIDFDGCLSIESIRVVRDSQLSPVKVLNYNKTGLTYLALINLGILTAENLSACTNLLYVNFKDNALPEADVDKILADLDINGLEEGVVDLSGGTNSTPSAAGLASKANLVSKGWTVTNN